MSEFGDMYREMAKECREKAEEYEQKAKDADARDAKRSEADEQLSRKPKMTILAARGLYEKAPQKTIRSDDSYSQWEDTVYWHELTPENQLEYVHQAESMT